MPTALSLLAQELKFDADEQCFASALLRSTPVALRGEETLIPVPDLLAAIQARPKSSDTLKRLVIKLMQSRTISLPNGGFIAFSVLISATWIDGSKFLRYELSQGFLRVLNDLASTQNLEIV